MGRFRSAIHNLGIHIYSIDACVNATLRSNSPKLVDFIDVALSTIFGLVTHNAFNIIAALVFIVLGLTGLIDRVVVWSIGLAWFISVLWIARGERLKKLSILSRVVVILVCGLGLGISGEVFGTWALDNYKKQQAHKPQDVASIGLMMAASLYPVGALPPNYAGITWNDMYVPVIFSITAKAPIESVDVAVSMDTAIAGIGQVSDVSGVVFKEPPEAPVSMAVTVANDKGHTELIPIIPTWKGAGAIMPSARIYCPKLLNGETMLIILASAAMNPVVNGEFPQTALAPRRDPKTFKLVGTFETGQVDGPHRYPVEYHVELKR